jgi:hypothetical protein
MGQRKQRQANLARAQHSIEGRAARALDDLSEFEDFRDMFLPSIRKDLMAGASWETILKKYKPIVAARLVQIAAVGGETASLGAIRELLDRTEGKAVQKQEHTHRLAKLPEEELDAVLKSKLEKLTIEASGRTISEDNEE